jgi:tripartite ATP-independent transporter DctM subunit
MDMTTVIVMFGVFFVLLGLGVPVSICIGLASLAALVSMPSLELFQAATVLGQKMATGIDSFALLAVPFFILAGNIMNRGGIAMRLIEFAKVLGGRLPGSLAHVNVLANMMFGSISGSAVASAAAVGGVMSPVQKKEGYAPGFSAAVNAASCPTGLLIPPSNTFIIYSLISGGTSIGALFLAGYLPGLLMGGLLMVVAGLVAKKRNYPLAARMSGQEMLYKTLDALPSLGLVIVVMGGIIGGIFTATEASAIAVVYCLVLALVFYREIGIRDLPGILLESAITTSIVMLLIGASMGMSWAMVASDITAVISDFMTSISDNKVVILLVMNLILLVIGIFMDMTPALLIFTPIFLPIATGLGMDPVHFGCMMVFNLSIGIITPPVGSALFISSSVSGVSIPQLVRELPKFFLILLVGLMLVTFIPEISLFLPKTLIGYGE